MEHAGPKEGDRIPSAQLGVLKAGKILSIDSTKLFGRGQSIVVGVPGAYTPICTKQHLPDLVGNVDRLRSSGYDRVVCIAANDPFVTEHWARMVDPEGKVKFLADGNLEFTRAMKLVYRGQSLFIGARSERYLMIVEDGVIARLRVEHSILDYQRAKVDDIGSEQEEDEREGEMIEV